MSKSENIDTVLLACTHYPLLEDKIRMFMPPGVKVISQGEIVAESLADYLLRHPEIESQCTRGGQYLFFTTDSIEDFDNHASIFFGRSITSQHATLS